MYKFIIKVLSFNIKKRLRKMAFLEKFNNYLRKKSRPDFIITKEDKHKIFLDKEDSLHLSIHNDFEPLETNVIKKCVKKGDIVLDLGANIGYYSLLLAKLVGKEGKVYAFEPELNNFNLLKKNIEENNYKNIIPIKKAVSNKNGKIKLYLHKTDLGRHTLTDFYGGLDSIEIDSVRLDDFFKDNKEKISFIKMDIEGSEGRAILGMFEILKRNNQIKIFTEFHPLFLNEVGKEVNFIALDYLNFLKERGFDLYDIKEEDKFSPQEILDRHEKGFTYLLCSPKKKGRLENEP